MVTVTMKWRYEYMYLHVINAAVKSMEPRPSWEVISCSGAQEFPKVHNHVYKSPPLVPVMNQINPGHTTAA
jgi:hypothetical protein